MLIFHKTKLAVSVSTILLGCSLPLSIFAAEQQKNEIIPNDGIEVIEVSYGYGSVKKQDLTGAVSTVDLEDLVDQPSGNVMQNLQGRIPGLQITTNGSPLG